jgi:hypothetical protein
MVLSPLFLISFSNICLVIGLLGSIASIWCWVQTRQRKKHSDRFAKRDSGYERGFTVTVNTFKRHQK